MADRRGDFRIGQGFDAHAFGRGDHVTVGGVRVPYERGVEATSDGDVALHALCDALLGAAALGDLGDFFPSGDPAWEGADSRDLLRRVVERLENCGLAATNVDVIVICQAPRLSEHRDVMRANIARDLRLSVDRVSVKFTTTDRLGFIGRGEGLAAQAIVMVTDER